MQIGGVLDETLTAADAAVDELLRVLAGDGLDALPRSSTADLLETAVRVERLSNRLAAADRSTITELERCGAAEELSMRSAAQLLADRLRIGRGEARRRVRAAAASTEPAPDVQPDVADQRTELPRA